MDKNVSKVVDVESTSGSAAEMHRLLDNACDSLSAVLTFCHENGVTTESEKTVMAVLNSMQRDETHKRFVYSVLNGDRVLIDVDNLNRINAARSAYANQLAVSVQDVIRFEKSKAEKSGYGLHCNHPGCSTSKDISFDNPVEMLQSEERVSIELWYCHRHRKSAFDNEGALSDELLLILQRIAQMPGLTQAATGAKKEDLAFLESVGLIHMGQLANGSRVMCYQISITKDGQEVLSRLLAARSDHL